jgi:hypothetical protein
MINDQNIQKFHDALMINDQNIQKFHDALMINDQITWKKTMSRCLSPNAVPSKE